MTWPDAIVRLDQDGVWKDREGREHDVADIDPDYAGNIVGFLERQAGRLHRASVEEGTAGPWPPVVWLHGQVLVKRLVEIRDAEVDTGA